MRIERILNDKKRYLDLLLLADESETMIDKYLENGDVFGLYDEELRSICVLSEVDQDTCELKNIATYQQYQGKGFASALIEHISEVHKDKYKYMLVGTGEVPSILRFYERCGFIKSHIIKNFFVDHYDHVMFEEGVQLIDMVYLKKTL